MFIKQRLRLYVDNVCTMEKWLERLAHAVARRAFLLSAAYPSRLVVTLNLTYSFLRMMDVNFFDGFCQAVGCPVIQLFASIGNLFNARLIVVGYGGFLSVFPLGPLTVLLILLPSVDRDVSELESLDWFLHGDGDFYDMCLTPSTGLLRLASLGVFRGFSSALRNCNVKRKIAIGQVFYPLDPDCPDVTLAIEQLIDKVEAKAHFDGILTFLLKTGNVKGEFA
ncbi:hypothetical protein DAPPUDRAFT_246456 [Daphnia pulex]|uniref:Uncharacterized protein n=1 Tax=Daphnia pulex TaxID=6669 RepID=E9GQK0_DAPPU|nr:hypothetical protein DAPPUDRAFT_246456 [Daphnia pulex]|eukprot:EFX78314.1 hypothetical protein DAPPUDRAFT_246456 [Daphnia pulex]